jgi:hypothetical protein
MLTFSDLCDIINCVKGDWSKLLDVSPFLLAKQSFIAAFIGSLLVKRVPFLFLL